MLYQVIVFLLILIIYSQIVFQLKKGDEMEIYETDFISNRELNDSANLKQPFIFAFSNYDSVLKDTSLIADYGSFDVFVKDNRDYHVNQEVIYYLF